MRPGQEFDEVHVISDLHMGGVIGFQIFGQGPELAAFVDHLRASGPKDVALVINGDMVDFLAEPGARYFDPEGAATKLKRISGDPAFQPVWEALRRFVAEPRRHLILTLGNHDLELSLPWVRQSLLDLLSGGDDAARGRVTLAFDGTGYACTVGGVGVLCVHGNEVDTWNLTDHEKLRRLGRDALQGRAIEEWTPNAGTKLVIDVMNEIKRRHAFVDLLKPEVKGVVPILWALDEAQASKLAEVTSVASHLTWDTVRKATGFLAAGEEAENASLSLREAERGAPGAHLARLLGEVFQPPAEALKGTSDAQALLDDAEERLKKGLDPMQLLAGKAEGEKLGMFGAAWSWLRGKAPHERAWEAVKGLMKDRSFVLEDADETYERLDAWVGSGFGYMVAGHTHLARARSRSRGGGVYYNSGTWARLMQLTKEHLSSAEAFRPVFDRLRDADTIAELEDPPGLVIRRPTVVSIWKEAGGVQSALREVLLKQGNLELKPLKEQ